MTSVSSDPKALGAASIPLAIQAIAIALALQAACAAALVVGVELRNSHGDLWTWMLRLSAPVAMAVALGFLLARGTGYSWLAGPPVRSAANVAQIAIGSALIAAAVYTLVDPDRAVHRATGGSSGTFARLVGLLVSVVVSPALEETLFRGALLRALMARTSPLVAIFVSSLAFAAQHPSVAGATFAFLFSCLIGLVFIRTRSLLMCFAVHASWNGTIRALKTPELANAALFELRTSGLSLYAVSFALAAGTVAVILSCRGGQRES